MIVGIELKTVAPALEVYGAAETGRELLVWQSVARANPAPVPIKGQLIALISLEDWIFPPVTVTPVFTKPLVFIWRLLGHSWEARACPPSTNDSASPGIVIFNYHLVITVIQVPTFNVLGVIPLVNDQIPSGSS
jgi:hypothetical protein